MKVNKNAGFSLVEVLLAIAILGIITTAVFGAVFYAQESNAIVTNRNRALSLAEEGLNATQSIRDDDFTNLADGTYGLSSASSQWAFAGSSDVIDIFTREIEVSTVDATTKQILSRITWTQNSGRSGEIELITYLSNIYRSEIVAPLTSWANAAVALNYDASGNNNGKKIQTVGTYAYILRAGGSEALSIYDISDPLAPSFLGGTSVTGNPSDFYILGNYAYVTSNNNSEELQIFDVSTPSTPTFSNSVDLSGNANGTSVYAEGNYAYVGRASSNQAEVAVIDITTPASASYIGGAEVGNAVNAMTKSGNYLFVGTNDNNEEIHVIDVSTPASASSVYTYDTPTNGNVTSILISGTNLFVGTQNDNLYILDATNPLSFSSTANYDANGRIDGIDIDAPNDYIFLATRDNNFEFQVLDISTIASPVLYGSASQSALNDLVYYSTTNNVLGVSNDNNSELVVFEPQ